MTDQQPVPDVARLLDEDIIKAVPIVSARQDTFEWSDLRDVADAATEKAFLVAWRMSYEARNVEVADYGNRLMMSSETNGLLAAKVAELQRQLGELQQEVDKVDNELELIEQERDAARDQRDALVEAFKSKEAMVEFEALFATDGLADEEDATSVEEDLQRYWLTIDRIAAIAAVKEAQDA